MDGILHLLAGQLIRGKAQLPVTIQEAKDMLVAIRMAILLLATALDISLLPTLQVEVAGHRIDIIVMN